METPKISVIMPAYNAEKYIQKAIDSVLNQTYRNFELIIIDDCSQDSTMDIVNIYIDKRIHIIHNPKNSGIAYSRNAGLDYSTGKYIAIMDDDDISISSRFEKQIEFLETNESIDVVGGRIQLIDSEGTIITTSKSVLYNPRYIRAVFLFNNNYVNSEVMFRKSLVDTHNIKYKDNYLGMEDFGFWIDCSKKGNMSNIDELLLQHRMTEDNETNRVKRELFNERKKLFADLQKYSLYESGFRLHDDCLNVLCKFITENGGKCETKEELQTFYKALREVVKQANVMKIDNRKEIQILCKKQLTAKIYSMDNFWEIEWEEK
ncbi:MAG: glycosyltransferase [Mobilitalea sp.]